LPAAAGLVRIAGKIYRHWKELILTPIVESQTRKKQTLTKLMIILGFVMMAGSLIDCSQSLREIPEEIRGKYVTGDPGYENHFFELKQGFITLGFADGSSKFYDVKVVGKKIIGKKILYTVLCANVAEGEEFNLSFFYDSVDVSTLHFKNKPDVTWEKEKIEISTSSIYINKTSAEKYSPIHMSQECCR
jgi:hypothetical protein